MACACLRCLLRCRELAQITIPAGLLSQADGEALKELLRKGPVSVALNWTDLMPKASKVRPAAACLSEEHELVIWSQGVQQQLAACCVPQY